MGTKRKTSCAVLLIAALSCAPALAQSPVTSSGGPQEGIKVHGDWVIEVRNPDGSLADRREFRNALMIQGGTFLSRLLGRQRSTGFWVVILDARTAGAPKPCADFAGVAAGACGLFEAGAQGELSFVAHASINLQLNVLPDRLQLTGSVTATTASAIDIVTTAIGTCPAAFAPTTPCQFASPYIEYFSGTSPNAFTPVNVVAGQIIQVTVSFTFS